MDNDLAYAQRLDPYWNKITEYKQFHKLPQTRSRAAFVKTSSHMYKIDDRGILRHLCTLKKGSIDDTPPAVLPAALYGEVLKQFHDEKHSGHQKFEKLLELIRERYYFSNMASIVKQYCDLCPICQQTNNKEKEKSSS